VLALVLGESILLTVAGGTLGMAIGVAVVTRIGNTLREYLSAFLIPPRSLALGVALMIALGLAAGSMPAARAVRLRIAVALARG